MSTLVVHPDDRSTDFLRPVYQPLDEYTLVTGNMDKEVLRPMIQNYNRIILLGHGTADGLLAVGQFPGAGKHIIDDSFASLLQGKDDLICIWCHADQYVNRHGLRTGFHTGMFISETIEALYYLPLEETDEVSEADIEYSNILFAELMGQYLEMGDEYRYSAIRQFYFNPANPVIRYNAERLYSSVQKSVPRE